MFSSLYVHLPLFDQITCDAQVSQAASDITSSYDALLELFECLGSFLKCLEIYINIPPTQILTDILAKIMAELLSVLAMATKQIKQGRFSTCTTVSRKSFPSLKSRREVRKEAIRRERGRGCTSATGPIDPRRGPGNRRTDVGYSTWSCKQYEGCHGRYTTHA
jgi:hypothetical protein